MSWRVAGLGTALVVVLAGAWYLTGGPTAPSTEPEPTVAVEQSAPQKGGSEGIASGDAGGEKSATGESSSEGSLEEQSADEAPSQTQDSSSESPGETTPETPSEPPEEESTPEGTSETPEEEPTGPVADESAAAGQEANESGAVGQGAADTDETQVETRQEDLPPPIAPLLDVTDPTVLREQIDERVDKGQLTPGDEPGDFFTPDQCYIFVVEGDRVQAVLGPRTDGGRPNLRTGEKVEDWSSRYSDSIQIWVDLIGN